MLEPGYLKQVILIHPTPTPYKVITAVCLLCVQEVTTALEQFSHYNAIWEEDRDTEMEAFLKEDPKLSEFEAQIKHYEQLEVDIMGLPEYYDVGPLAMYTGEYTVDPFACNGASFGVFFTLKVCY